MPLTLSTNVLYVQGNSTFRRVGCGCIKPFKLLASKASSDVQIIRQKIDNNKTINETVSKTNISSYRNSSGAPRNDSLSTESETESIKTQYNRDSSRSVISKGKSPEISRSEGDVSSSEDSDTDSFELEDGGGSSELWSEKELRRVEKATSTVLGDKAIQKAFLKDMSEHERPTSTGAKLPHSWTEIKHIVGNLPHTAKNFLQHKRDIDTFAECVIEHAVTSLKVGESRSLERAIELWVDTHKFPIEPNGIVGLAARLKGSRAANISIACTPNGIVVSGSRGWACNVEGAVIASGDVGGVGVPVGGEATVAGGVSVPRTGTDLFFPKGEEKLCAQVLCLFSKGEDLPEDIKRKISEKVDLAKTSKSAIHGEVGIAAFAGSPGGNFSAFATLGGKISYDQSYFSGISAKKAYQVDTTTYNFNIHAAIDLFGFSEIADSGFNGYADIPNLGRLDAGITFTKSMSWNFSYNEDANTWVLEGAKKTYEVNSPVGSTHVAEGILCLTHFDKYKRFNDRFGRQNYKQVKVPHLDGVVSFDFGLGKEDIDRINAELPNLVKKGETPHDYLKHIKKINKGSVFLPERLAVYQDRRGKTEATRGTVFYSGAKIETEEFKRTVVGEYKGDIHAKLSDPASMAGRKTPATQSNWSNQRQREPSELQEYARWTAASSHGNDTKQNRDKALGKMSSQRRTADEGPRGPETLFSQRLTIKRTVNTSEIGPPGKSGGGQTLFNKEVSIYPGGRPAGLSRKL